MLFLPAVAAFLLLVPHAAVSRPDDSHMQNASITDAAPDEFDFDVFAHVQGIEGMIQGLNVQPLAPVTDNPGGLPDAMLEEQVQDINNLQRVLRRNRAVGNNFLAMPNNPQFVASYLSNALAHVTALQLLRRHNRRTWDIPTTCNAAAGAARHRSLLWWGSKPNRVVESPYFVCANGYRQFDAQAVPVTDRVRDCVTCVEENPGCPCTCWDWLKYLKQDTAKVADQVYYSNINNADVKKIYEYVVNEKCY